MGIAKLTAQARKHLDDRFGSFGEPERFQPPVRGWIRAIREGLGMTTEQLAKRLHVRQPSVVSLEQSEAAGTIELATLRRVAEAMNCRVIYALVPNEQLDTMVRDRARLFERRRRAPVEHSMLLEDQAVAGAEVEDRLEETIRTTNPRRFWADEE